ncbi:MAG: hypothetical protein ACFCD0_17770 [Gemmataceae bacterium]
MLRTWTTFVMAVGTVSFPLTQASPSLAQPTVKLREVRVQRTMRGMYFHVRFSPPENLYRGDLSQNSFTSPETAHDIPKLPRLVSHDANTKQVYQQLRYFEDPEELKKPRDERDQRVDGLEFVGKLIKPGRGKFLLVCPIGKVVNKGKKDEKQDLEGWKQIPVEVDFSKAKKVFPPERPGPRVADGSLNRNDLEALWAYGQANYFAYLNYHSYGHGFFGFARAATGRKYGVTTSSFGSRTVPDYALDRRMYDLASGSAAITESLQLRRLLRPTDSREERSIPIGNVGTITSPDLDWDEILKDKTPKLEAMAQVIPENFYYVRFRDFDKLAGFLDVAEKWGAPLLWAFEPHHREYRLRERYETQLCLPTKLLAKELGDGAMESLAVAGSDPYLRDGSDVTIIVRTKNPRGFLNVVDGMIERNRKRFDNQIQRSEAEYQKVEITSFTTPFREISLHRAVVDDFVFCSNSRKALELVLDTHQGWRKPLAKAKDFQYMRTVFPLGQASEQEDGFVFLSDAFFRSLAGGAIRIKAKRRTEALTSLAMVTHGAMFTAWETGKFPRDTRELLLTVKLGRDELRIEGNESVRWDRKRRLAMSRKYNTRLFATPLLELPIDKITPSEQNAYNTFRRSYRQLWSGYVDPIGIKIVLQGSSVKIKTHQLPMIQDPNYAQLRRLTGNGVAKLDPTKISKKTLVQFLVHVSPTASERDQLSQGLRFLGVLGQRSVNSWLGESVVIRFDDSKTYEKLFDLWQETGNPINPSGDWDGPREAARLAFQTPITVGIDIRNPLAFSGFLAGVKKTVFDILPGAISWESLGEKYKGKTIVRIQTVPDGALHRWLNKDKKDKQITPALYYTLLGDAWLVSTSKTSLEDVIDQWVTRKKSGPRKVELIPVNASVYVSPGAAVKAKKFLETYLEWDVHRRAMGNVPLWTVLYRTNLVNDKMSLGQRRDVAFGFYGFVPSSPDEVPYQFNAETREVLNRRHGSIREPQRYAVIAADSPLAQFIEEVQNVRADLLFTDNGLETTLLMQRSREKRKAKK